MPRYKLDIEYEGSSYVGWQRQKNGKSIQGSLEYAIFSLFQQKIDVFGAGRTDAGVHALSQVAHFDSEKHLPNEKVRDGLNYYLKFENISVLSVSKATCSFHARFSAVMRHYMYRILNRRSPPSVDYGRVWHVPVVLNAKKMHDAAQCFVGYHDFTTFRAAHCQSSSPFKTISYINVAKKSDEIIVFVSAKSFLHSQVRSMVGSLKLVGEGKWSNEELIQALLDRDRAKSGPVAPSMGLYLSKVDYVD
tara:strand:+ start:312 stop:1055 length:744 start_codon:yes stop_codon:yes gene_type:complete